MPPVGITRIRGTQIQNRTITGINVDFGTLLDEHLAANASIAESKLDIAWSDRYQDALETKKVVDYVQVNGTVASGSSVVTNINNTTASTTSNASTEGILVDSPKNRVPIRNAASGDSILDANDQEVYGRITFVAAVDEEPAKYVLSFYSGNDVAYTFASNTTINWQYAQRFNLYSVSEMFAANEKFVEGAADVTAYLNIEQLAKDLYGSVFTLDRDGNANLSTSLADQIANEVTRAQNAEETLQDNIDQEVEDRETAVNNVYNDFASNLVTSGATLVGVDTTSDLNGLTVQEVLEDLESRMSSQEQGGGQEVTDTHTREAASTNGYFAQKTGVNSFASLEDRLEDIEYVVDLEIDNVRDDLASTANLKGASLVGIEDVAGNFAATTVEGALAEIISDLSATTSGNGASKIGVEDTANQFTATTVEGVLAEIQDNVDNLVSDLASTANGDGASLISIEDAAGNFAATTVEGALAEIISDLASTATGDGASKIGVEDDAGNFTATTVEGVLAEIASNADNFATELASTANGEGASLIGVQDAAEQFTATTVEGVLAEIQDNVDNLVSDLASTANGDGASLIGIEDAAGNFTATTVEGALAEIISDLASTANGDGASKIGVEDTANQFTATTVEGVLAEIQDNVDNLISDLASTANGDGASLVGIEDAAGNFAATTVEGALAEIISDLASTANGDGASKIGIEDTAGNFSATTVEGALAEIISDLASTATGDGASKIGIEDAAGNFTATTVEGALNELEGRIVTLEEKAHEHKKAVINVTSTITEIDFFAATGEYFVADGTLNVYVNGILQANGFNFDEIKDGQNRGTDIDFGEDELVNGDRVVIEYVVYQVNQYV